MLSSMGQDAGNHSKPTVYVVDGDSAVRDGLYALFSGMNLDVQLFHNAEAFLAAPEVKGPSCLVAELQLPGLSGIELLDELRYRERPTPAVLLSSDTDLALAARALRVRVLDIIEKPIVDQQLIDGVSRALGLGV